MNPADFLPVLNATLNGTSTVLLVAAFWAVKTGRLKLHKRLMLGAFAVSAAFLVSYAIYHFGFHLTKAYKGPWRSGYLLLLLTHTVLAATVVPLVLMTLARARKAEKEDPQMKSPETAVRFARHRAIAKWTFPIWLYVSVTGVVIYFILYVLYP